MQSSKRMTPSIAPLHIVGVYRIFSYTPTNLNAFKLFRRFYLSLVSLGAPSASYYYEPRLYQSLCVYYNGYYLFVKSDAFMFLNIEELFEMILNNIVWMLKH